jgi:hypothetical protein
LFSAPEANNLIRHTVMWRTYRCLHNKCS